MQLQQKKIETDPNIIQTTRLKQLLPLLLQEHDIIQQQIDEQAKIVNSKSATELERIAAAKEVVKLQAQQLDLDHKIYDSSKAGNYFNNTYLGLKKLAEGWADLGTNAVTYTLSTMQNGLEAVSQSLAAAVQGTKNWGQAWADAMRQAVNGIIQMAAQYVAAKLAMMAVDAAFSKKSQTEAATTTATSGIAGIAKAGSQGGWVGVLIYMGVFLAAMAAMEAIAAGVSGRATGGPVDAGTPYMVGERGPELIVPRSSAHVFTADQTANIMKFSGGGNGPSSANGSPVNMSVLFLDDPDRVEKEVRNNPSVHHVIVDVAKRNAHIIAPRA